MLHRIPPPAEAVGFQTAGLKPFVLYAGQSSTPSYRNGRFAISDSGIKSPSVLKAPPTGVGRFL
jgi:hypothetical protein